ncbi:MAG: myo-inosose-2 dehydratase [Pontibacterium sp.]
MLKTKLGIAPIAWWNDDDASLSDDVSLDECLRQAAEAGFSGMETGRRFPMSMELLKPTLDKHHMSVCGGWFSGMLLNGDIEIEKSRIQEQLDFFKDAGAPCIVYGEVARSIQGLRATPIEQSPRLTESEIAAYGAKISEFSDWCQAQGMPIAYHHHMGAAIETEEEIDLLMKHSTVPLLLDTGHLTMAGGNVLRVIEKHHDRIIHVHTKDVRATVLGAVNRGQSSFIDCVINGIFTVPGDGDLPFADVVNALAKHNYEGWFVVEAEQDPKLNPPLEMAKIGFASLNHTLTSAGYEVIA